MKAYVATKLTNAAKAVRLRDLLVSLGHSITFDWMESMHEWEALKGDTATPGAIVAFDMTPIEVADERARAKAASERHEREGEREAMLVQRAQDDANGVVDADVVIAILPGGAGTHVEIGIALGVILARVRDDGAYSSYLAAKPKGPKLFLWADGGLGPHEPEYPSVFYRHPLVEVITGDLADCISRVEAWSKNG
jgi:hypothetical protein